MPAVLNPAAQVRVAHQGHERQPVVVIDDMLAAPELWRASAGQARFAAMGPYYPGIRAPVLPGAAAAMRGELVPIIAAAFGIETVPPVLECFFSIVTTPPAQLAPIQRLPHVDGLEPDRFAILIYLSGADRGGTAFYRQRATGFETVDAVRFPAFEAALAAGVAAHGLPPADYIRADTPLYERIAQYEARPNRCLIYRSHALHCAAIPPGVPLPADPGTGRLSVNSFLFG